MAFARELAGTGTAGVRGQVWSSRAAVPWAARSAALALLMSCRESKIQTISSGTGGAVLNCLGL